MLHDFLHKIIKENSHSIYNTSLLPRLNETGCHSAVKMVIKYELWLLHQSILDFILKSSVIKSTWGEKIQSKITHLEPSRAYQFYLPSFLETLHCKYSSNIIFPFSSTNFDLLPYYLTSRVLFPREYKIKPKQQNKQCIKICNFHSHITFIERFGCKLFLQKQSHSLGPV